MAGRGFIFILVVFLNCTAAFATNYYVSSSAGDDAAGRDGKSPATAWKTFSRINSGSFSPGDSIFLKRGDTWRETLNVPSSGNATSNLYFGAYGTGNNPVIIGSELATTWTNMGGNVWKTTKTFTNPRNNTADIHFIEAGAVKWTNYKSDTASLVAKYDWTWLGNYIYIYSTSDPATLYSSVEIPQRYSCIDTWHKQYLVFDGIDVIYPEYIGYDDNTSHTDNIAITGLTIENCEVSYVGGTTSIQSGFGIAVVYSNLLIRNCKVHDCGRRGISLDIYGNGFTASNAVIEHNTIYGGFHTTGVDLSVGSGGYTGSWNNVYIRNNTIEDFATGAYVYPSNQIFLQNWAWSTQSAKAENIYIMNNVFKNPNGSAINMEGMNKIFVYNNLFYETSIMSSFVVQLWIDANNTNLKVKNNIFYSASTNRNFPIEVYCVTPYTNIDFDYNLYYRPNNTLPVIRYNGTDYYTNTITTSLRSSYGWETHCPVPANPNFMSLTDYHVQGGSPAIGAGIAIAQDTSDFEDKLFTNPPNIGIYATPVVTASPSYLGSVIENATSNLLEIRYNISLANVVPASSSFTVMVNSVSRSVSSVAISAAEVKLTLSSPVAYGDVVTVAYTKPASGYVQSSSGAAAASFTAQSVINNVSPVAPQYLSAAIANATPTLLELTYDLSLSNITPDPSAFTVYVNSVKKNVSTVSISGTKVKLTLPVTIVYGDVITVAYTKPAVNPLQTSTGGQAATFTTQSVVNNVSPVSPVCTNALVDNASPTVISLTFSLTLTSTTPDKSAFAILVNSVSRSVNSLVVSGATVSVTLSAPVVFGDVITIAYTMPGTNQLQTSQGGKVTTFPARSVTNNVGISNTPPVINVNNADSYFSGFVGSLDASGSTDANNDILAFTWTPPAGVQLSSASTAVIQFLPQIISAFDSLGFVLDVSDGKANVSKNISVLIKPYKPDLIKADVLRESASSYLGTDVPSNISDSDITTFWSSNGDYQWLIYKLKQNFLVDHIKLAFSDEISAKYSFDVLASRDSLLWDPLVTNALSCGFSKNLQVFPSEGSTTVPYSFIKLVGHGNTQNMVNKVSEMQVFGRTAISKSDLTEIGIKVYPNPTHDLVNVFFEQTPVGSQVLRIQNMAGQLFYEKSFNAGINYLQIPVSYLPQGVYVIELISDQVITGTAKFIIQ